MGEEQIITLYLWPVYHDSVMYWYVDQDGLLLHSGQYTVQNSRNQGYVKSFDSGIAIGALIQEITEKESILDIIEGIKRINSSYSADIIQWVNYSRLQTLAQTKASKKSSLSLEELTGIIK